MIKNTEQFFIDNFTKASALYKEKKFLESLTLYKELLSIKPNQINLLNNIGLNYEKLKQYDEALNYYERCDQINPNEVIIINNLTNIYCKLERYIDALPLLKKVIDSNYQNESNHEKLATCLFNIDNRKNTKNFIELALITFPNNNILNELLGKTLLSLNFHKDAIKYLQKGSGLIEFNNKGINYLR